MARPPHRLEAEGAVWEGIVTNVALCDVRHGEWNRVIQDMCEAMTRSPANPKVL